MLGETPDVRFICVYLYCNEHIGLSSTYKIPVQVIQLETGFDISVIRIVLDRLQEKEILVHKDYLWVKLLREDYASLLYSGSTNDKAKENERNLMPGHIIDFFDEFDTSIDTTIDSSYKLETINNKLKSKSKKPEKQTFGELENVKLTSEEYEKLIERFNEFFVNEKIFDLDNYIGSTGKRYKSHYATILSWAKRDYDKGKTLQNNIAFT